MNVADYVLVDPGIMLGKPTIRGTRITVELVLRKLAEGASDMDLVRAYPQLSQAAIRATMQYAAEMIAHEETVLAATA